VLGTRTVVCSGGLNSGGAIDSTRGRVRSNTRKSTNGGRTLGSRSHRLPEGIFQKFQKIRTVSKEKKKKQCLLRRDILRNQEYSREIRAITGKRKSKDKRKRCRAPRHRWRGVRPQRRCTQRKEERDVHGEGVRKATKPFRSCGKLNGAIRVN